MRGLYAITPETGDTSKLVEMVRGAIAGGASIVQYRSKRLSDHIAIVQAKALREITRANGIMFIVNDSSELAFAVGADGVHLGRDEGGASTIDLIRQRCVQRTGPKSTQHFIIGVSCYNELSLAKAAAAAGADYVAFGSFFSSPTKPQAAKAELSLIRAARAQLKVPIVAIGGITVDNAHQLISADADMVAVITSLFEAADIEQRAREFTNIFKAGRHVRQ